MSSTVIKTARRIFEVLEHFDEVQRPVSLKEIVAELDYPVSTGIGQRRCYAECCIQTHLLWLMEQGKVDRVEENNRIAFAGRN